MTTEFSQEIGEGGEFEQAFKSLNNSQTTYKDKTLPPKKATPAIPARSGASAPITAAAQGGGSDLAASGARTVSSTDGIITIVYPETVTVVINDVTLTLPAIIKQP